MQDLQELSDLLRDSDMGAMAKLEQIKAAHGAHQAQLKALDEAIGMLDFAAALRHCQHLTQKLNSKGHHAE
ncbi:MAG: hypothetical protein IPF55_07030 [Rhodoferax sp.]|nr:hypothetical protein [Rhodoferax sp.]